MVLMTTTKTTIVAYVDGHSSTDVNSGIFPIFTLVPVLFIHFSYCTNTKGTSLILEDLAGKPSCKTKTLVSKELSEDALSC